MSLEDNIRRMRRVAFLNELSTDALRLISFSAETHILRAGDALFHEGEASNGGYLLLDGEMALESMGRAPHKIAPDSLIGELALVTETRHPASAVAVKGCTVLKISRSLFTRVLNEYPSDAKKLRDLLTQRTRQLGTEMAGVREKFLG